MCFCRGLRFQDLEESIVIQKEIQNIFNSDNIVPCWRLIVSVVYSVKKFNWIAVLTWNKDYTVVIHSDLDWQKPIVEEYKKLQNAETCSFRSRCVIPQDCDVLSAIMNGNRRYLISGEEFKYDGTDAKDYFFDENHQKHPAPWSIKK